LENHAKTEKGDIMELLLKRNENPGTFGTRYELFAKLELNPDELALIRKATPDKTYIVEDEYGKSNFRWRLMLIPAILVGLLVGILSMVFIHVFLGLPIAIITCIALQKFFFNQVSGNVTVGDIIRGRTIHCKSLDELLIKERDIREKIINYCKNLEAMHSLGDVQRIDLNQV
jgi:hypothetical protein